jgi:peptidoglycan/xylan/chitin deacetylase (PgdA/CDA1 family)
VQENGDEPVRSLSGVEVRLDSFREQIAYLTENYDVLPLEEAVERINRGESVENVAVITFDDGWKDNYTNAYPVLVRQKVPATIFLVTDYVGTTHWFWPERVIHLLSRVENRGVPIPESMREWVGPRFRYLPTPADVEDIDAFIDRLKYLSKKERESVMEYLSTQAEVSLRELEDERILLEWNEVEEMANNQISFGSHTETHPILTQVSLERARREIVNSKKRIENHLGRPCSGFAYPNGDWNERVRNLVIESEYTYACSLSETASTSAVDVYSLRRRVVHEGFAAGVDGKFSKCIFGVEIAGFFGSLRSILHRR